MCYFTDTTTDVVTYSLTYTQSWPCWYSCIAESLWKTLINFGENFNLLNINLITSQHTFNWQSSKTQDFWVNFVFEFFHDKIKFYILRQNLHQTCFTDFSNVKWCMKKNLQFKFYQVSQASVAYLDEHSTLDPEMVSVVSSIPSGKSQHFVEFF